MKTLPIYTYGFEVLRKKTKKVTKIDDKFIELVGSMFNTMHKASGIGLAAPQIGSDMALTVIDISRTEEKKKIKTEPLTLINPVIKDYHGEITLEEGCLSIPYVRGDVTRPETIYVEYQDLDLNRHYIELKGFIARVAQHEIDHLNGILFIDHLNKDEKKILKPELDLIRKGEIETDYLLAELPQKGKGAGQHSVKHHK
ncbi:MAG TPA: peptide deformylase [Ignavibacteria bacterium]|nr:peptide deformylase [Ignavibacteria bacterium]